ncbi:hypothetical protein GCM10011488_68710 [Steroidobacter agaridevorans]|nr:hypothetical protein GCM10011488_68710 [Steroidobacter agaridevorans]
MSWASDDLQYVSLCDGGGFEREPKRFHNSRMLAISGNPDAAEFHDVPGYPSLARPFQRPSATRYYSFGTLALDGRLYQFLSTFNRPLQAAELDTPNGDDLMRFTGAKLIYSHDNGLTWNNQNGSTPVTWNSWSDRSRETMVFFEEEQEAFSMLSILQMGKNYEHNRDGYIYVYSPNGNTDGTMNELVLFRTPKAKLLDRKSYRYFAGSLPNGDAKWTPSISDRAAVHTFPRGWVNKVFHPWSWMPSVVYNEPLGTYMMSSWGTGTSASGVWFDKPSYLGFWSAPNPWGPWTLIHEETAWTPGGDARARAFAPQISPKWLAKDGKSLWLVWSDFQVTDNEASKRATEDFKRHMIADSFSEDDIARSTTAMRSYMPYYTFNTQRVDLSIA